MMHQLRAIPCGMLAHAAIQPRVLVALIQCPAIITTTEVVEVATESKDDVQ